MNAQRFKSIKSFEKKKITRLGRLSTENDSAVDCQTNYFLLETR